MREYALRRALTVAAAAVAAGARAVSETANRAGEHPNDAQLFALERAHAAYDTKLATFEQNAPDKHELWEHLLGLQHAVLEAMNATPADTLAGAAAKARVTARHRQDLLRGTDAPTEMQADALDHLARAVNADAPADAAHPGSATR